ncbi:MAG: DUF1559 domain-containing protein [Planctomycetaceae bacterium]
MKFSRSRQGFTLVELLVVIAIIGTLVSLLLPAVQQARESARRMSCGNNIRQIALSLQMYHDTHNAFPINYGGNQTYATTCTGRSWMIGILPFIEKTSLYDQIDKDGFTDLRTGSNNEAVSQQVIKTFMCPSDGLNQGGAMDGRANVGGVRGITNYKAVAGANWAWGAVTNGNNTAKWPTDTNGLDRGNGVVCRNADGARGNFTTMASVIDGTSNSFAVGEAVPAYCTHTWWWWFNGTTATCSIPVNYRRNQGPVFMASNAGDWPNNYSFMSLHPAGAQFAFVDGHVAFIPNSIDINVYRGAATISGGETTSVQ